MQLRWGLWPGVLAPAVANAVLYHVLEPLTADTGHTNWFATETGLVYGLVLLAGGAVFLRFFPLVRGAAGGACLRSFAPGGGGGGGGGGGPPPSPRGGGANPRGGGFAPPRRRGVRG